MGLKLKMSLMQYFFCMFDIFNNLQTVGISTLDHESVTLLVYQEFYKIIWDIENTDFSTEFF